MVTGFAQGITAAQAFVRIGVEDKVSAALAVVQGKLNVFAANVGRVGASIQRIGLGGGIFGAGIIYGIKKATEESSRATEVNTAYAATFRELTVSAEDFANTLATRFKRDVIDVKDIQRSFFGLFAGQGFERGFSKQAANIFTRLSYDFSSFFNQTVDEAAGRMLSALSNSAEVVQRFGFNVRAPALESAFKDLGINKSIEQASEAEKLIARVMILLQTSGEAQLNIFGDIDRTINEFANQTRGLQSSITIFLRAIGKPFEQALAPIIGGFAKATMGAANWVSENPKLVTQIGGLTAGLVTGGAALISFGFALRVVSFSMGPFVSILSAPILVFAKLFDVVGFATAGLFHFARFGIGTTRAAISTLLPLLGLMSSAYQLAFRTAIAGVGVSIPLIVRFGGISAVMLGRASQVALNMGVAFTTAFRTVNQSTYFAIAGFFGLMRTVRSTSTAMIISTQATAAGVRTTSLGLIASAQATSTSIRAIAMGSVVTVESILAAARASRALSVIGSMSMITLSRSAMIASAGVVRSASAMIVAATVTTAAWATTSVRMMFNLQSIVLFLRKLAVAMTLVAAQGVKGLIAGMATLGTALASASVEMVAFGISGVTSFASITASALAAVATALAPFLIKLGLLAAIAATIAGIFYAFKDQIISVFSSIGGVVSQFASSATSVFFDFFNGAKFVFWDLVAFGKEQFYSLLAIGSRTFSALNDAMTAGDFKLAFQIAFAGAKEAAFSFMFDAVDRWGGTIESFVKGLIELKFWFLKTFTEITGFVRLAFDNMESYRQTAVNSISEGIIASLVKVGAVDAEVMQTLKEDIGRQQQSKADAIKVKTATDVAKLEGDKHAALGTVNVGVKEFSDGLKRGLRAAQREADALAATAAGKADAGKLAAANLGQMPGVQDLLNQIKSQTMAGSAGEKTMASLKGLDIRSSDGHQSFVDALNNKNSMKGIQDKLSDIEKKLVEVVPKKIGQEFAAEMENQVGVAGLPNQTKK